MKSYQTIYTELQTTSGEDSSAQLTIFKRWINDTNRLALTYCPQATEFTKTRTTVASQNNYKTSAKLRKLMSVIVTVGSVKYRPKPVESLDFWNYLQSLQVSSSDVAQYYYLQGTEILLFPTPATAGSTITMRGRKMVKDLSLDDYTTGTITTTTLNDETIVGSGTSWATGSVGNHIRIDYTTGDFEWYEIDSITNTTNLELVKPYEGVSISSGTETYTIGEFSDIPSEYHNLLIYRPLAIYYSQLENPTMANMYWRMYDGGKEMGLSNRIGGMLKDMMDSEFEKVEGVYLDPLQVDDLSPDDLIINKKGYEGEGW